MIDWTNLAILGVFCCYNICLAIWPEHLTRLQRYRGRWFFGSEPVPPPREFLRAAGIILAVLTGMIFIFGALGHVLQR